MESSRAGLLLWIVIGLLFVFTGLAHAETGIASFYGAESGSIRADGKRFDPSDPSICAHKTHRFGTKLKVTHLASGRSIVCTVRDRGPYIRGRIIDLTRAGARRLGIERQGVARVRIETVK